MSAIVSVTQIPIYGIATDDYINFKLLMVNIYGPAVCFELRHVSHYCTQSSHVRASVNLWGDGTVCIDPWTYIHVFDSKCTLTKKYFNLAGIIRQFADFNLTTV